MVSLLDPIPLRAIGDQRLRDELAPFDLGREGDIDERDARAFFLHRGVDPATFGEAAVTRVRKMAGIPWVDPRSMGSAPYRIGTMHDMESARWFYGTEARTMKGAFNYPGFGAGNVRVGRAVVEDVTARRRPDGSIVEYRDSDFQDYQRLAMRDVLAFAVDCNLVDLQKVNDIDLNGTRIVIAPNGFVKDHVRYIPLERTAYPAHPRGPHGEPAAPETKLLQMTVETQELRKLMGEAAGLEFFIEVKMKDGRVIPLNLDGRRFNNFSISPQEIAPLAP
jgi:hypothetical protein